MRDRDDQDGVATAAAQNQSRRLEIGDRFGQRAGLPAGGARRDDEGHFPAVGLEQRAGRGISVHGSCGHLILRSVQSVPSG
jgi:hypothetical protein